MSPELLFVKKRCMLEKYLQNGVWYFQCEVNVVCAGLFFTYISLLKDLFQNCSNFQVKVSVDSFGYYINAVILVIFRHRLLNSVSHQNKNEVAVFRGTHFIAGLFFIYQMKYDPKQLIFQSVIFNLGLYYLSTCFLTEEDR